MKFGVWTPLPHIGFREEAMQEAVAQLTELNQESEPFKAFELAKQSILLAEQLGFDATLVAERFLGPDMEAWVLASSLVSLTSKIHLIVAVHPGIFPPQLASKMGATLDQISRGRFHVNIVNGRSRTEEFDLFGGVWIEGEGRYRRTEEFVQVLKGFWQDEDYGLDGEFYKVPTSNLPIKPLQKPYPSIYAASGSAEGKETIAKECDVYFITASPIDSYRNYQTNQAVVAEEVRLMKERAARYGRSIQFALSCHVLLDEDQRHAEERADALEAMGESDRIVQLTVKGISFGLVGSPETIAQRIKEYEEIGIDLLMLRFYPGDDRMKYFAETVIPLVNQTNVLVTRGENGL